MSNDVLTEAIVKLFEKERFYAEILLQMDREFTTRVEVAGVYVSKKIHLAINEKAFRALTINERVAVLKHECQHILHDHIGRSKQIAPDVYKKTANRVDKEVSKMRHKTINIAADLAINPGIRDIPEWALVPSMFDLDDGHTLEGYLELLKNNKKAKDFMEFDDHAIWSESEEDEDVLRERIKKAINAAASKGNLTSEQQLLVDKLNTPKVDWKKDLKRFVARQIESSLETTRKKRNRRYGIDQPGHIKVENLVVGVAIDTSGSVSDEALIQFMTEIGNIAKYAKVIVVEADAEVKNSYVYDPKKKYEISGRGGTAYMPAINYFTDNYEIDGLIYFGDMDCFDEVLDKPKYPVLWAIVGDQDPPVSWGSCLRIHL